MILKLFCSIPFIGKVLYHFLQSVVFQSKTHYNKNTFKAFVLLFLLPSFLFCQNEKETILLKEIEIIDQSFDRNLEKPKLKYFLKKYKSIARKSKRDVQLSAVANAVIGKNLSKKGYHDAATKFLKKAYKCRKKQNKFIPQRWALNALIENGEARDDYDFLFKYAKDWINLSFQHKDQLHLFYENWGNRDYFSEERERLLRKIHPEVWSRTRKNYRSWDKRREHSQALVTYYFTQFPKEKEKITQEAKDFYEMVFSFKGEDDIEEMLFWKKVSTETMKKYASPTDYANHLRYIATLFRKKDRRFVKGMKTAKYEKIGIGLMQEYIEISKQLNINANVLFGTRYLATRFAVLKDYKQSVQHLATAIKYCRLYKMEDEIVKSIGGLHSMLYKISKNKDQLGLQAAKHWKDNYELNGLLNEDVERIDNILKNAR